MESDDIPQKIIAEAQKGQVDAGEIGVQNRQWLVGRMAWGRPTAWFIDRSLSIFFGALHFRTFLS